MNIADKSYVAIDYILKLASGEEVDRSPEGESFGFIIGASQVIPGLEQGLMGKSVGYQSNIVIDPDQGYGLIDDKLIQEIPRNQFPADETIEPGMTFQAQGAHGPFLLRVKSVNDNDSVTVDLNHPLAGEQLHFDVKVVDVREASAEELKQVETMAAQCGCGCGESDKGDCGSGCNCG
jgi:FKBP-type peptidyl-prolyl cis-trans isomerase SlyD